MLQKPWLRYAITLKKEWRFLSTPVNFSISLNVQPVSNHLKPTIMQCPNCKATHGCGCQARQASDGTACCSKCVGAYNQKLAQKKGSSPAPGKSPQVKALYRGPGIQT